MTGDRAQAYEELSALYGERVLCDEPLARHTSFGIGGPADVFVTVCTPEEVCHLADYAQQHDLQTLWLGGGTNVLVSDAGTFLALHQSDRGAARAYLWRLDDPCAPPPASTTRCSAQLNSPVPRWPQAAPTQLFSTPQMKSVWLRSLPEQSRSWRLLTRWLNLSVNISHR